MLTAAHVADLRHEGKLCIHSVAGATEFAGKIGTSLLQPGFPRNKDPIDIAFLIPLQDEHSELPTGYAPVQLADIDAAGNLNGGEFCLVSGFPVSRSWAKRDAEGLVGSQLNYVGIALPLDAYGEFNCDPRVNILIEFHMKKAIYSDGEVAYPPSPRGLSGGGVFVVPSDARCLPDSSGAKLVGIMHTFDMRNSVFVATKIHVALGLLMTSLLRAV